MNSVQEPKLPFFGGIDKGCDAPRSPGCERLQRDRDEEADPVLERKMRVDLDAIDALFRDGLQCKLCELYTLVYDVATQRGTTDYSAALYDMYRKQMREAQAQLSSNFAELLAYDELQRSQEWLQLVVALLEGQARFAHIFVHGFEYLDRYYVKGDAKKNVAPKPTLREMSYKCYAEEAGLRDLARRVKAAFTHSVCEMAERRGGAASGKIVQAFAIAWRRLFGCLLGSDWEEEYNMHSLLERHRHASLVGLAAAAPLCKSIWTPQLVGMITEFVSDSQELHVAYGVKNAGFKCKPIIHKS